MSSGRRSSATRGLVPSALGSLPRPKSPFKASFSVVSLVRGQHICPLCLAPWHRERLLSAVLSAVRFDDPVRDFGGFLFTTVCISLTADGPQRAMLPININSTNIAFHCSLQLSPCRLYF